MKLALKLIAGLSALVVAVVGWNYVSVGYPVASHLSEDPRNNKVSLWTYHQYGFITYSANRIEGTYHFQATASECQY